ncbi:bifunctional adenosylcobinamide kinase/adenosylcobinamide-phosphate guanylyltransferase [Bacillus sp. 31A1R]|uniref:Bifunctional adenosylcobinamide kinase/adenosylcobinamide-phosphate guanylyltransferase n=1 Tax=Robertmurraya mangrovi TaxID=3098077 RepID=A0ABU5J466_9BACI|nr:bifunctional adenosylcobinamide kinase/adenosylcobinamide-phosphate guanylyltransferase [Bacillus sp. 31A1R]MDZ5474215.1 bifunctional adenosylcobinamide kinase/adenosylcobinamide-phosphate guanylyltransferase [Bacillus sp. 31A1R]
MHFVTGGAFNGKRAWVKNLLNNECHWISSYQGEEFPNPTTFKGKVVLEGMEQWTKKYSREHWRENLKQWLVWEKESADRQVIVIGTDIMKGIVPMEKEHRNWRDLTGWVYQDIVSLSSRVDIIWYGINQTIKEEEL